MKHEIPHPSEFWDTKNLVNVLGSISNPSIKQRLFNKNMNDRERGIVCKR